MTVHLPIHHPIPPAREMITTSAATPVSSSTLNSNNNKRRGAFILLEGVDRCGKTTQVGLLVKHLLSLSIATVAYRFPDRTTQGEKKRKILLHYLNVMESNMLFGVNARTKNEHNDQNMFFFSLLYKYNNKWAC
jgi:hypothetical protein